ncbi:MAG: DUF3810 domain-containing protein [Coriobacteriales bacterium]|jgi:hypothetical protein|nr:DUF3810 domain-containing protein [Coriobacteriales bacterium]
MDLESEKCREARKNPLRRFIGRHLVLAGAAALLGAYYLLRNERAAADYVMTHLTRPWHRLSGGFFGLFPFSVAEWLCALVVVGVLIYLVVVIVRVICQPQKLLRIYGALISLGAGALMVYALVCWLWGIGFYSYTYTELSGIKTEPLSVEQLKEVTISFAEAANAAGEGVSRNENGVYSCDIQKTLREAPALYTGLPGEFSFLEGPEVRPKALVFSSVMSEMNFTGGFFPFTGEANINVLSPDCFIPSATAHELAHQRGVTREQDANFTAVLVCLQSDDINYVYSGALLAYIHLANALYEASYEDWVEAASYLGENAQRDLAANNKYWAQYDSKTAEISELAYTGFLHNQGQVLGMRSYGACVDLLVAYYGS